MTTFPHFLVWKHWIYLTSHYSISTFLNVTPLDIIKETTGQFPAMFVMTKKQIFFKGSWKIASQFWCPTTTLTWSKTKHLSLDYALHAFWNWKVVLLAQDWGKGLVWACIYQYYYRLHINQCDLNPFSFFPWKFAVLKLRKKHLIWLPTACRCGEKPVSNSLLFHAFAQNYSHSQLATWIQCRWAFMGQFMSVESGCQTVIFHSPGGKFEPYYLFLYSGCMEMCHLIVHGYYEYDMNTVWLWRSLGPTQAPFHLYSLKQTVLSSLVS